MGMGGMSLSSWAYIASFEVQQVSGAADFECVYTPFLLHSFLFQDLQATHFAAHGRLEGSEQQWYIL